MAVTSQEQNSLTDDYPLLTERLENHENQHFIDLERGSTDASSSGSSDSSPHGSAHSPQVSTAHGGPSSSSESSATERIGCTASLPLLYWRYLRRNQATGRRSTQSQQPHSEGNTPPDPNSYITISFAPSPEDETRPTTSSNTSTGLNVAGPNIRLNMLMDHFKMALDCFFAVWFVVGNVWIFGDHSSSADAPNLYRLSIVFLSISCIGYAMPFILCGMICCCLPCIISILGIREDMNQIRGATEECINALPKHKFKLKMYENKDSKENDSGADEGGLLAAGTENERAISGEDAVCCICLAKYTDDDLLRVLPCTHFFHTECVDRWLKINASCPLCKFEISTSQETPSTQDSQQQQA